MKPGYSLLISTLATASLICIGQAQAQTGRETIEKLVQVFTAGSGKPSNRQSYQEASQYIDYRGMAQRSLNADEWKKLSAPQKEEFTKDLRALIEERYYARWHKIFSKGKLAFTGETSQGGDALVNTKLTLGKKVDQLQWRLDCQGTERKVVSLSVGDSDLLKKLSSRLQGRLNKYGFTGLLVWMKNKANIAPTEATEEASSGPPR